MRRFLTMTGLLVGALALGGCNTSGSLFGGSGTTAEGQSASGTGSAAHNALFGQQVAAGTDVLRYCPRIEVRDGSNVWRQGGEGPMELRYQGTITDVARECRIEGGNMVVRVGVEGRVLTGPKGEGGRMSLPIRIAVTRGLSQPVWTRLYHVPIEVPAGAPSVTFTQVEDGVQFALPEPAELAEYIIFVGFDNQARSPEQPRRGRGARAAR